MAGSRLPNFGSIFSRATGLLQTGAMKEVPIWYNVYKKHPPKLDPCSDRPMPPQDPIPEIVYEEDFLRAKKKSRKQYAKNLAITDTEKVEGGKKISKLLKSIIGLSE